MTMLHPSQIRCAELEAQISYCEKEITTFEARITGLDTQLANVSSRTANFSKVPAQQAERQAVAADLETLRDTLADAQQAHREARAAAVQHESRLREWQRTIDELPALFQHPAIYNPDFDISDPFFAQHRKAINAAAALREWGIEVPRQITITIDLGDMESRPTLGQFQEDFIPA